MEGRSQAAAEALCRAISSCGTQKAEEDVAPLRLFEAALSLRWVPNTRAPWTRRSHQSPCSPPTSPQGCALGQWCLQCASSPLRAPRRRPACLAARRLALAGVPAPGFLVLSSNLLVPGWLRLIVLHQEQHTLGRVLAAGRPCLTPPGRCGVPAARSRAVHLGTPRSQPQF